MPLRSLLSTEVAFAKTNLLYPLNVTIVLRLSKGPDIQVLKDALKKLQERHAILNIGIEKKGGSYWFVPMEEPRSISLDLIKREDEQTWRREAERVLNTFVDMNGPAMRALYLPGVDACELILVFHHSFVDSRSMRLLLDELLCLCGGEPLAPQNFDRTRWSALRPNQPQFPADFRRGALWRKLLPFLRRQLRDEWRFKRQGVLPPIPDKSYNATINLSLSPSASRKLLAAVGRKGLSLNSILGGALLLSLVKHCHADRYGALFRAISFVDIRPYFTMEPKETDFGCFISMLRFTLPVLANSGLEPVAQELNRQMVRAGRRGELQLFAILSKYLVTLAMGMQKMRLGNTAVSFMGPLNLRPEYGNIQLHDVHAYITSNRLGPSFSGFAKILFGRVELDLIYLPAEIDALTAQAITEDIRALLESFS